MKTGDDSTPIRHPLLPAEPDKGVRQPWPLLLVVDVEGNGAIQPELVEVAIIPIADGVLHPEHRREWLIRPSARIPDHIVRIHGITNESLAGKPVWPEVADDIQEALKGAWIVAHNASVEYNALTRLLPGWQPAGVIDTLRLARKTYPEAGKHGLDPLIEHLRLPVAGIPGQRHRAGYDAHATGLLLLDLAAHYDTWDELTAIAVPDNMPGRRSAPPAYQEEPLW
ncbi:3'-5' exonuclease [Streptomyces sp. SID13666]|uniref:3'-5' exonuclease n=1 Tax=Streptomyces sp. SID13666 TaxID=2706054 RepID=UPI0013BFEF6D|nr:3'-5' exonuclease [Streptomyces sp. SID13666]NEA53573.1 3'-5' exonuclease [Streptomyces sp. SID13666]